MNQDIDSLYVRAFFLASQTQDASCEYLQQELQIDEQLARQLHGRLIAEAAYLRHRQGQIKPFLPGRRLIRMIGVGRQGYAILGELEDLSLREAALGFDADDAGRLYLTDQNGHMVGQVAGSNEVTQRLELFEALTRSTRIVVLAGSVTDPAAAALLPLLGQGARRAGAWIIWLQCLPDVHSMRIAPSDVTVPADLILPAASFSLPGLDEGQIDILATRRLLQMVDQTFSEYCCAANF
jgi:hypothetical protein